MKRKMSRLNEELIRKSNLDIPDGPVKVDGATNPVYTDALNQHAKREKEVADMLKDASKVADIDTPFTGSTDKKNMPKKVEEAKMVLDESLFEDTDIVAERDTEINKDMWSCIYNELCGEIKGAEAPYRRFKRKPRERYPSDKLGVGMNDEIIVKSNTEEGLDFAKEVADEYGVEFEIFERKSMYAPAKFEMFIYPDKPTMTESLLKESNNPSTYSMVAKHFDYRLPEDTNEVLADLVERAVYNAEDGHDLYDATIEAIDEGLIYTKDIWAIKSYYEDATLEDSTYEALYSDIQSIASELMGEDMDESLKENTNKTLGKSKKRRSK